MSLRSVERHLKQHLECGLEPTLGRANYLHVRALHRALDLEFTNHFERVRPIRKEKCGISKKNASSAESPKREAFVRCSRNTGSPSHSPQPLAEGVGISVHLTGQQGSQARIRQTIESEAAMDRLHVGSQGADNAEWAPGNVG